MAITSGFHPDDLSSNLSIRSNEDIHRTIASKIFNVPPEEVTAEQRRQARYCLFFGLGSSRYSSEGRATDL